MELFFELLALCEGINCEFSIQRENDVEYQCCLSCQPEQAAEEIVELPVIWDAMTIM